MKLLSQKFRKVFICIMLAAAVVTSSVMTYQVPVHAETTRIATITGKGVNFRSGPGTEYSSYGTLGYGTTGTYVGQGTASTGKIWYKLTINGKTGWVHSDYVRLSAEVSPDEDFEAYLTAQGFPESYKEDLRVLHTMYPKWIFEAQHTNLEWSDVIKGQNKLGTSLVHSGAISSWKSIQDGAYDWTTSTWKVFDSGGWVAASEEIIKYYVDPRNFLDQTNIFQFLKQSYDASAVETTVVRANLKGMVEGTFLAKGYDGNAEAYLDDIMNAAATNKVSPYVLAAMILQEQGTDGSGSSISGTVAGYEGYYNFFNIGAYATSSMTAVQRGLWYASGSGQGLTSYYRPWTTRNASILGGSKHYGEGFVSVGQDTMYLKKFDLVGDLYTHQYMTNIGGAYGEGRLMAAAYNETARNSALVFKIPVFKNMPEKPCAKPTGDGSPNYMLKSLTVNGYSLTPTFSMYETSYSLIVPNGTSSVTVSASAYDSKAKISGTGSHSLSVGTNTVSVKVTAENGAVRTYTIKVVREAGSGGTSTPTLSSSTYKISGSTITGLTGIPTTASTFKSKLSVTNGSVKICSANGTENSGNVGTGNLVKLYDTSGNLKATYTVVVYGDTNGDGVIDGIDVLRTQKQVLGIISLNDAYKTAANVSKDGTVDGIDVLRIQKHVLNIKKIDQ